MSPVDTPIPSIDYPTGLHNFTRLDVAGLWIYYLYTTPVGFKFRGRAVARRNEWRSTTGRHLTWIEATHGLDKSGRVDGESFMALLHESWGAALGN